MKMWIYVIRRLLLLIPVLVGVMTVTFAIISALPVQSKLVSQFGQPKGGLDQCVPCSDLNGSGTPCPTSVTTQAGYCENPNYYADVRALGLDQPIYVQWGVYMHNTLTLNWGSTEPSSKASKAFLGGATLPVTTVLSYYLPYTLELATLALLLILLIAIPLGNYSAVYRNQPLDQGARLLSFSGFALPGFLLATILLLGVTSLIGGLGVQCNGTMTPFAQLYTSWPPFDCVGGQPSWISNTLHTSPTGFPTIDALIHGQYWLAGDTLVRLILPALAIAYGTIAGLLRFVRNSMLEVMNLDFIRTARSKGVSERVVVGKHAGRNSLNVTITILGLTFASFVAGFAIIESVFNLRGVGLILATSIQQPYDFGLIFGSTLLFTIIVVIADLIVDVLYSYLDPRVRLG